MIPRYFRAILTRHLVETQHVARNRWVSDDETEGSFTLSVDCGSATYFYVEGDGDSDDGGD